jgi:type IX secretion system substrate protein
MVNAAGSALTWNPSPNNDVHTLVVSPSSVFIGGDFTAVGYQSKRFLAKIGSSQPAPLTAAVIVPNGGERLLTTSTVNIVWDATGPNGIQSVDLQVSRSGPGGPWEAIAYGLPNSGSYPWFVTGPTVANNAFIRIDAHDYSGSLVTDLSNAGFTITSSPVAVPANPAAASLELSPPAPNPSGRSASISFDVPARERVRLSLYDVQGREVEVLTDGEVDAGPHRASVDAAMLHAGLYFVRLQAEGTELTRRLAIVR